MDNLRVMYDISVLGTASVQHRSRTGVFRVVENLAAGLVCAQGIEAMFCALERSYECAQLIKATPQYVSVPFTAAPVTLELERRMAAIRKQSRNAAAPSKIPLKAAAELLRFACRMARRYTQPIQQSYLNQCDIFHSPYLPIPQQVKEARSVKRFLMVHDLVPVLHPEFFAAPLQDHNTVRDAIDSIDTETWVLSNSQATKDDLCSYRKDIDPARVFVTPLAASEIFYPDHDPEEQARVRQKYDIPEGPYILSLSTLEPRKNINQTVRCFARMIEQEHISDLLLVLVGAKGWDYDKIFEEIQAKSGIRERIIVTGYADDDDLSAIYSGATAFVYPSFYEGFGLPPLEAMQCGVPVITSNTSSLPEVVGDAGIMVSPTDADALCHAVLTIYRDHSLRQTLSARGLQRAKQFTWDSCLAKTIDAYRFSCNKQPH